MHRFLKSIRASSSHHSFSPRRPCGGRDTSVSEFISSIQKRYSHSTVKSCTRSRHRALVTLNSAQLESSGQQIFDFSNAVRPVVHLKGVPKTWDISYVKGQDVKYPSHAQGVLYYHHPQEIRFRVCRNVQEFERGTDLRLPNDQRWSIFLPRALRKCSQTQRSAILDLISDERRSHANWRILPGRHITTLSPAKISNQQLVDLSGLPEAAIYTGPTGNTWKVVYKRIRVGKVIECIPFPDGSAGVFYYKQSTFAPTRVGELRFRLCNNKLSFDQGTDLLLPSGDIWHVSSDQLSLVPMYRPLRDLLSQEGLLDLHFYPDTAHNAIVVSSKMSPHLLHFSQPFVVDLARTSITIHIWVGSRFERIPRVRVFVPPPGQGGEAAYRGRAAVRLEASPQPLPDATSGSERPPLFVLRFLEMLTPIEPNPECLDNSYMARPEPRQLYMRRHQRIHLPWAYFPRSDEVCQRLLRFIQESPDIPV